jgi:hypothetical protein
MSERINQHRRRLHTVAGMTVATTQLGMTSLSKVQAGTKKTPLNHVALNAESEAARVSVVHYRCEHGRWLSHGPGGEDRLPVGRLRPNRTHLRAQSLPGKVSQVWSE